MAEYFSDLNYTLSNEDTQIEWELLPAKSKRVFSIAGSGARCLPLISKAPEVLDVIDMSVHQLYLCELRVQACKALTYNEWLYFMGYRGALQNPTKSSDDRAVLFEKIELSTEAKTYWISKREFWKPRGFIFLGRWESHFQKIGVLFREVLRCDFSKVFEAQSLEEQIRVYESTWPKVRWNTFMRVAASEYVFNKFLYKGHFSGDSSRRTESRAPWEFLIHEFDRVFRTQLLRKNYFMQVLFLGGVKYEEGLPFEAHQSIYELAKKSPTKVNYRLGNLLDYLKSDVYDFISLSDTISYLPEAEGKEVLQKLRSETPSGTLTVIRSFLRAPAAMNSGGWSMLIDKNEWARKTDGTAVYEFHIYQKN